MGELPETQHHSKRLEKGSTAHCLRRSLRWINYFTILGSVLSMAAILIIRHNPTWAGWVFLALGGVTVISGILGCISSEGCFSLHFLTLGLSLGGLGAASLASPLHQAQTCEAAPKIGA
ncbi:hypothetical protein O6H91_09G121100 [Diphasiastrum complanatum]|uniref:Uncharacterized protein n=2 Tax=Diphasiastrum complanatum TaxID=34168 RepID=A0ACC2CTW8_DIPCM|nr:hypothetical protein O6H91_Y126300 [Diphasiastrum complanatum]KAJ7545461.1 hypothetical protein O6H91_09G121100 [Diphasiastrum complanatum]KAJ7545462.1 hypothetical protein O6H91_09G121100 [Diphasiastrum complanatum]